jgi:carbamoyltransferase
VDEDRAPRFYHLLHAFHHRTGCPVLATTDFNVRGEPLVCAPQHALRCFLATGLDLLVLENVVVSRDDLDELQSPAGAREELLASLQIE